MSEPIEYDVRGIIEHFADLPDPRSSVNQRHLLVDVVVISVCAVLSGSDWPSDIEEWATCRKDWLREHLALPNGTPSHDTIRRVLQRLPPTSFQRCFAAWLKGLIGSEQVTHLAIDGKTLRGSRDSKKGLGALHMVSVWAHHPLQVTGRCRGGPSKPRTCAWTLRLHSEMRGGRGTMVAHFRGTADKLKSCGRRPADTPYQSFGEVSVI